MANPSDTSVREALATLGLSGPASPELVKAAFRAAVKASRPDHPGGDADRFRKVIEAHRLLQRLYAPRPALDAPAATREWSLDITPAEAVIGVSRTVVLPNGRKLGLRLPGGLRAGAAVRLKGQGDGGGDLYMTVKIPAEDTISVIGDDLWMTVAVAPRILTDGGRVEVVTPLGPRSVWAPPALPDPARLRLKGQGLPPHGDRPRGHLFLTLVVGEAEPALTAGERLARFTQAWTARRRAS